MSRNLDRHMSNATWDLQPPNANIVVASRPRLHGLTRSIGEPVAKMLLVDPPPALRLPCEGRAFAKSRPRPNGRGREFSPVEMEAYSLQGMKKMVSVIGNLRKMNPKLRFLGMVPNKVDARKPRHVANLATLQQAYPQLVLPFSIGARDSIAEALGEQMPVWKIKKTAARKATQEVRALGEYVFTKMEIAQ